MDRWDMVLAAFAAYVAVVTLARLMAGRRNELVVQIREQFAKERADREAAQDEAEVAA